MLELRREFQIHAKIFAFFMSDSNAAGAGSLKSKATTDLMLKAGP